MNIKIVDEEGEFEKQINVESRYTKIEQNKYYVLFALLTLLYNFFFFIIY